jgi:hypothetical protein
MGFSSINTGLGGAAEDNYEQHAEGQSRILTTGGGAV